MAMENLTCVYIQTCQNFLMKPLQILLIGTHYIKVNFLVVQVEEDWNVFAQADFSD